MYAWCRWWVPAALALDAALRFIGFPSLTKTVGICVFRLAREYIGNNNPMWGNASENGAPKQVPVTHPRVGAGQRLGRPAVPASYPTMHCMYSSAPPGMWGPSWCRAAVGTTGCAVWWRRRR